MTRWAGAIPTVYVTVNAHSRTALCDCQVKERLTGCIMASNTRPGPHLERKIMRDSATSAVLFSRLFEENWLLERALVRFTPSREL
jgi:hypothetical protein